MTVVAFALSFYGLNDYGRRSMALPPELSPLVPLGVDGLTVVAIAATFMLRHAPRRVRAYAWAVFAVAVALSMAGNHQHAVTRGLDLGGTVGFTVAPAVLALSAHLVVVTWRNLERAADSVVTAVPAGVRVRPPVAPPPPRKATAKTPAKKGAGRKATPDNIARMRELRAANMQPRDIAAEIGVSERTVWRHLPTDTATAV